MARRPVTERLMWTRACWSGESEAGNGGNKPPHTVPNSASFRFCLLGSGGHLLGYYILLQKNTSDIIKLLVKQCGNIKRFKVELKELR